MKVSTHTAIQTILTVLQGVNVANMSGYLSFLPAKWQAVAAFGLTTVQAALGVYNHYFHTDGTLLPPA